MDYIMIGPYQFDRDASKDDMRLDYCSSFQEVALDESSLSFDTVSVEVCTKTIGAQLSTLPNNTPIIVYRGGEIKARFVSSGVSRIGPVTYQLTGRSPMGALTGMVHTGGIYTGQTVEEVVKEICGNIPSLIKSVYAGVKLYGWLPYADGKERSARDNLAQVLFAIGAYLRTDLNGVLRIEPLWDGTASLIDVDRSYIGGTVKYDSPISAVTVTEHQYVAGTEVKELFSGTAQNGDIITFSEPMHSLSATGFTILESGANYAKISAGTGALTGKAYIHNTRLITQPVTAGAVENIKSVTDATLVSLVNSYAVAKRLADYYRCRETITNDIVSGHEKPGHVVSVYHPYDKKMVSACIQSLDTTISATLKSSMEALVGFTPAQPDASEYFDAREELTKDGEWTSSTGKFTAVLIGGAWGGFSGKQGASGGTTGKTYSSSGVSTKNQGMMASKGGDGGEAGLGGSGGRILQISVTCDPGTKFSIHIGKGGAGGGHSGSDSVQGSEGSATTFGTYTSADGAASNAGYLDLITGEVYAARGAAGIPGGKGGGTKDNATAGDDEPNEPGGSVVDDSGTVWLPGATPQPPIPIRSQSIGVYDSNTEKAGDLYAGAGPGIGGGAAVGANGSDGDAGYGRVRSTSQVGWGSYSITCNGGTGGKGADAVAPDKVAGNRGTGGRGGHGGGGGGGFGICEASSRIYTGHSLSIAYNVNAGTPGQGGNGSDGGEGGDGCVLIYYRKLRTIQPGPLATADGKWLLDKLGRRMIV
nr:MAG TPA: 43 kDa tail protein [Caudoviricetes sp.]